MVARLEPNTMRSDAIDELLSTYLEMPARVSWEGAIADPVRGVFEGVRLELAGLSILALPFDRLVLRADRFQFTPGIPARIEAVLPRVELSIDQRRVDRWLQRVHAPFELRLIEGAIEFRLDIGGFPVSRTQTEFRVQRGWMVLRPKRAEFLGIRARLVSLFRAYFPLPRLAPQTRLTGVEHAAGTLRFELGLDDFMDVITPGLVKRLQNRFLPFAK